MPHKINYIIADDDHLHRELTNQYLITIDKMNCIGICSSAEEVAEMMEVVVPDLLILDIEMPGISGLELARSLTQFPFIIFITSHSHFAKEAFDVDAVDFLTKPISTNRLERAVEKVKNLAEMKRTIQKSEGFKINEKDSFFIKEKNAFLKICYSDVLYIESLSDFVIIFLKNGKKHIALANMKSVEQQLPKVNFIRISRSHMVNKQLVTSIEQGSVFVGNIQLTIGKTYMEEVMNEIVGDATLKRYI